MHQKIKFTPMKIHKTVATRAVPFGPDMHQIVCRLGLRPRPHWGRKGSEGQGREGECPPGPKSWWRHCVSDSNDKKVGNSTWVTTSESAKKNMCLYGQAQTRPPPSINNIRLTTAATCTHNKSVGHGSTDLDRSHGSWVNIWDPLTTSESI